LLIRIDLVYPLLVYVIVFLLVAHRWFFGGVVGALKA
jgi:hypothetical protein